MKKFFTLLALTLLCAVGAKAQTTLFHWQSDGNLPDKGTSVSATGGTVSWNTTDEKKVFSTENASYNASVTDDALKSTETKALKSGGNVCYLVLELSEGTFGAGDEITVCGYNPWKISTSADLGGEVSSSFATGTSKTDYNTGTVTIPEGVSTSKLYLSRATGTGTGIAAVRVYKADNSIKLQATFSKESDEVTVGDDAPTIPTYTIAASDNSTLTGSEYSVSLSVSGTNGIITLNSAKTAIESISTATSGSATVSVVITPANTDKYRASSTVAQYTIKVNPKPINAVSDVVWNFSDSKWSTGTIASTIAVDELELVATSDATMAIDENSKSIDGYSFTKRVKLSGTGKETSRHIHFKVSGDCIITVYGMSGSSGTERSINLDQGGFGENFNVATLTNDGTAIGKVAYKYTGDATDFYVYSAGSGNNIYAIKVKPLYETVNIGKAGLATYVSENTLDLTSAIDGLKVYEVTGSNSDKTALTVSEISDVIIGAGTGVLLEGDANSSYRIPRTTEEATFESTSNKLRGSATSTTELTENAGYILNGTDGLFYACSAGTLPAGKCYVKVSVETEAKMGIVLVDSDEATGINNIQSETVNNGAIYNLSGARVSNASQKGVYIMNGKKYIVK